MSIRMLIDARHREETRVAVVKGNRVEEFDFESEEHKQLKGNIYLAKVTRVEPSLQAAFIDYGGNRHGFLAFSEIHPDYYQIPREDREALLREEAEQAAEEEALRAGDLDDDEDEGDVDAVERLDDDGGAEPLDAAEDYATEEQPRPAPSAAGADDGAHVESLRQRRMNLRRRYKIQDVIRRRQVLLVQVVKEERGNKGAALTTYLSLAGRYCVLMPNTSHGGGISRKISNAADRKRLKSILADLNLPKTMGCIVRTAGLQRTRAEIRRDFDYLARLWDEVREKTLGSSAPAEIYRDNDLVKRAIRDIYSKDIDEVIVEGEDGYRAARSFMKLLMPTHARRIAPYSDAVPLFQRHGVEEQLAAMYQPVVQLKSGGYLVINPTEALVSIDINSGRSTREHNIEQTALNTNLEAAHEIARQLRLRDMAGLIVIDFIDMESSGNNRKVEKAMKEALRNDRARIQVGRISGFGLFEMSRQRLRTGMLEASTRLCPHCEGSGFIRTASSSGLQALRLLEEEAARGRGSQLRLRASQEAALYVLNRKRAELADVEERYGVAIEIVSDGAPEGARMSVESGGPPPAHAPRLPAAIIAEPDDDIDEAYEEDEEPEVEPRAERGDRSERAGDEGEGGDPRRKRRRRRRRSGRREDGEEGEIASDSGDAGDEPSSDDEEAPAGVTPVDAAEDGENVASESDGGEGGEGQRRRRRSRRGGRGRSGRGEAVTDASAEDGAIEEAPAVVSDAAVPAEGMAPLEQAALPDEAAAVLANTPTADLPALPAAAPDTDEPAPKARRRPRARKTDAPVEETAPSEASEGEAAAPKPRRRSRKAAEAADAAPPATLVASADAGLADTAVADLPAAADNAAGVPADRTDATGGGAVVSSESAGDAAPRRGWWQRTFGA